MTKRSITVIAQVFSLPAISLAIAALCGAPNAGAYPPAPHHLIHGLVRDSLGTPINGTGAQIILMTPTGTQIKGEIIPGIEPGLNYRLEVPIDSGMTSDLYKPTALNPAAPFRIWVVTGSITNLPIEMVANYSLLGQAGKTTRLDLTLGEDTDHDGLPDAWERLFNPDISKVTPDGMYGNGMTYRQAYYAGVYAVDPSEGFALNIASITNGYPVLEFTVVQGRTYSVQGSTDLQTWTKAAFRIPAEGARISMRTDYLADQVQKLQVEVPLPDGQPAPKFFRLMLVQ